MTIELCQSQEEKPTLDDCGVYAVYSPNDTALIEVKKGNDALVNRGEHSNGAAYIECNRIHVQKFLGTSENAQYDIVPCRVAIGHDRYTTSKETTLTNAQPVTASFLDVVGNMWVLALAHNGNVQADEISYQLQSMPEGSSDSAYIAQLIAESPGDNWLQKLKNALPQINGSYSCTMLTSEGIWAFRDPRANRPLWVGLYHDGTKIVSSETYELELRDGLLQMVPVLAGEAIFIDTKGNFFQHEIQPSNEIAFCAIEAVYLQRHCSKSERNGNPTNYELRKELGVRLAQEDQTLTEKPIEYRLQSRVVAIPNGGIPYAEGFSEGSGIKTSEFLEKIVNARSYIAANGDHEGVAKKKLAVIEKIANEFKESKIQHLYLIDDSLIRGSQILSAVQLVRESLEDIGLRDICIHVRICAPVINNRCDLGIVIREHELFYKRLPEILYSVGIESSSNPDEHLQQLLDYMGIASLQHISTRGLVESLSRKKLLEAIETLGQAYCALGFCISCMQTGENPIQASEWYLSR